MRDNGFAVNMNRGGELVQEHLHDFTKSRQKKLSKLTVVLALAVILPLGYIILVVILYKLNMRWRNRKKVDRYGWDA